MTPDISNWGDQPPRFITLLADLVANVGSKEQAAKRLGVSRTTVSTLLSKKYDGGISKMEARILDMLDTVECPIIGAITAVECQKHREAKFTPSNPQRVALFRACKTCPRNPKAKGATQ